LTEVGVAKALACWFIAMLLVGCASGGSRYADEMNALIGKADKETIVSTYGPPDKQAAVTANVEVWEYRLDEQKFTSNTGYRFSTHDRLRLTFKDGRLQSWSRKGVTE
jgi:hypothetical protein